MEGGNGARGDGEASYCWDGPSSFSSSEPVAPAGGATSMASGASPCAAMDLSSDSAPVLTGVSGMEIINDMFQRQARRVESQLQQQVNDRKMIDFSNAQLLVLQSQLMWHAQHYQERAEQVTQSCETVTRMQSYIEKMHAEQSRSVDVAQHLTAEVGQMRERLAAQPERIEGMQTSLSEVALGTADLTALPHIGELFTATKAASLPGSYSTLSLASASAWQTEGHEGNEFKKQRKSSGSSASQRSPNYSHSYSSSSYDHNSHDSSCSDSADASAASTDLAIAKRHSGPSGHSSSHSRSHSSSHSHTTQRNGPRHDAPAADHLHALHLSTADRMVAGASPSSTSGDSPPLSASEGHGREGQGRRGRATEAQVTVGLPLTFTSLAPSASHGEPPQPPQPPPAGTWGSGIGSGVGSGVGSGIGQGVLKQGALAPASTPPPPSLPPPSLPPMPPSLPSAAPGAAVALLTSLPSSQTPSLSSGLSSSGVMQGVLPYPGQGLLDVQQGVVAPGPGLEPFGMPAHLAASFAASFAAGLAPLPTQVDATHGQPAPQGQLSLHQIAQGQLSLHQIGHAQISQGQIAPGQLPAQLPPSTLPPLLGHVGQALRHGLGQAGEQAGAPASRLTAPKTALKCSSLESADDHNGDHNGAHNGTWMACTSGFATQPPQAMGLPTAEAVAAMAGLGGAAELPRDGSDRA